MSLVKKFNYSDMFQRRLVYYNLFATLFLFAFILAYISLSFNYYAPYESCFKTVFLGVLGGLFLGNLAGRFIFWKSDRHRLIYILSDLAFIAGCAIFVAQKAPATANGETLLGVFFNHPFPLYAAILAVPFFAGIKGAYFLKIACGEFIDDHKSIPTFFIIAFAAVAAGIAFSLFSFRVDAASIFGFAPFLIMLPTLFLIRLPYSPQTQYAQEFKEKHPEGENAAKKREDIAFAYLNFSYILLYLFLGYQTIGRFFGDYLYVQLLFVFGCTVALLLGFLGAHIIKRPCLPLYTEVLYPPAFIIFFIAINQIGSSIGPVEIMAIFSPVAFVFGFSIYHTLRHVLESHDHERRFAIINFSLFILPVPILAALHSLIFTNLWFFALLYLVIILNTVIPIIHLAQSKVRAWTKALYTGVAIALAFVIFFIHIKFDIAVDDGLYIRHLEGYPEISTVDSTSFTEPNDTLVLYNGRNIFSSRNDTINNLQRVLIPLKLFAGNREEDGGRILFLDGNQRFFKNPAIGYFKGAVCLDYVPDRAADFRGAPLSGKDHYFIEHDEILLYLRSMALPADMIVDIPNLYDLACNRFRFSDEYYSIVGRSLSENGIFAQVFNFSHTDPATLKTALLSMKDGFSHFAGFLFSDHLIVLCTNTPSALSLSREGFEKMSALFRERPDISSLFMNEHQPLAHLLFIDIDDILTELAPPETLEWPCSARGSGWAPGEQFENNYIADNFKINKLNWAEGENLYFRNGIIASIQARSQVFTMLKKAALLEVRSEFDGETAILAQLRKMGDYLSDLRTYIAPLLTFKERYYYSEAVRNEKVRRWEEAGTLYRAIININPDNFEANYRLGILSITLQNQDDAFRYLQKAMLLKRDDSKVLYQMGVLFFAMGRPREALEYLTRAIDLKENTAGIFYYTGLCYEQLGKLQEAKSYYEKARLYDPNDSAVQSSMERIEAALEDERNRWKLPDQHNQFDVEMGESIPLPINKSAQDVRLSDPEAEAAGKQH